MKKNLSSNMSDGKVKFLSKNIFIPLTIIVVVFGVSKSIESGFSK